MDARPTPSLRIARLVISNFRTFHAPTEIALSSGGKVDEMPVFHGGNGTGKSNALAALEVFFRASSCWLRNRDQFGSNDLRLSWNSINEGGLVVSPRSWPPGVREPQRIEVQFADGTLFRTVLTPAGEHVLLRLEGTAPDGEPLLSPGRSTRPDFERIVALRNILETPRGVGSKPLFRLNARRHDFRFIGEGVPPNEAPATALSPYMTERLLDLASSLDPGETERWRAFVGLIGRFTTLRGRELSVVRTGDSGADLRFEIRGRQILRLSELSSGEQQVVALCAAVLTSRAAVVAIEEPEISLHPDNQQLMREVLLEQVRGGLVDQILLESHVPTFDGPEVLRFSRSPEGATSVVRQPAAAGNELLEKARASGAKEQWVAPGGYTQLPDEMVRDLKLEPGGYLWFLQAKSTGRWEAWTAGELDEMFGLPGAATGE